MGSVERKVQCVNVYYNKGNMHHRYVSIHVGSLCCFYMWIMVAWIT